MNRARSTSDFLSDPFGRYSVGSTHVVWCHSPSLMGTAHWGRPTEADAARLVERLDVSIHPDVQSGVDVLMDVRQMESFEWPTFGVISAYVQKRVEGWQRTIRRHAVIVPGGVVGVFVAGLMPVVGTRHPLRFFPSVEKALAWLERPELPAILEAVTGIVNEVRGVAPLVHALRQYLDTSLLGATVQDAAVALSLSPRTLQRALQAEGTRFSVELVNARLRAASRLLEYSTDKIEVIARRVGFASSSQLSAIFRREMGETPTDFRERRIKKMARAE